MLLRLDHAVLIAPVCGRLRYCLVIYGQYTLGMG
jgi:hypothetical protein